MHPLVDSFWKGRMSLKRQSEVFFDNPKKPRKACAIGAIYYGMFNKTEENGIVIMGVLNRDYPQIRNWVKEIPCEHKDSEGGTISGILVHLNDTHTGHDWGDKRIAEWLERTLVETSGQSMPPVREE